MKMPSLNTFLVKISLIVSAFLIVSSSFSQEVELPAVTLPTLPQTGREIQDFVPTGWGVELSDSGHLGGDGSKKDQLLLLKMQDKHNILHNYANCHDPLDSNPRLLVFLLARNGRYFLAGQNSTLIPRQDIFCDTSDPIDGVAGGDIGIDNRKGIINLGFWGSTLGTQSFHFQWRNQGIYLVACNRYSRQRSSGDTSTIEADYLKQQVHFKEIEFDENDDEKEIVTRDETKPISARPLIRLEAMEAYYRFDCATMR